MAISKRLRMEILRRDNHTCRYCGATAPDVKLTIDHVVPLTLGGTDDPSNLVTACADCNAGKSSVPADASLVDDVARDALRWSQAMQEAAQRLEAVDGAFRDMCNHFEAVWLETCGGFNGRDNRPPDWRNTIQRVIDAGSLPPMLLDAIDATAGRQIPNAERWRYFCGVCWRKIDQLREIAYTIVGEQ